MERVVSGVGSVLEDLWDGGQVGVVLAWVKERDLMVERGVWVW